MRKPILLSVMLAAVFSIGSTRNVMAMPLDLTQFKWKNRLLLMFAPDRTDPWFDALHQSLAARKAEVLDRNLVVFEILETGLSQMDNSPLEPHIARSLRDKFDIPPGKFTVILIGKDGGIKLKRQSQTQLEDIFALIDAMPMRQDEMRQKSQSSQSGTAESNESNK